MLRTTLLAALAAHAASAANIPRHFADECCPCPGSSEEPSTVTVTAPAVTVTAPAVTIEHTVTTTAPAVDNTVYITQGPPEETPTDVGVESPVETPSVKTVTVGGEPETGTTGEGPGDEPVYVTKTIVPGGQDEGQEGPKTVTVNVHPAEGTTITITPSTSPSDSISEPTSEPVSEYMSEPASEPTVVTVTAQPSNESPQPGTQPGAEGQVITKTVSPIPQDQSQEPKTVIISKQPTVETVTVQGPNGEKQTLTKTVDHSAYITVTGAPSIQTVSVDHYQTLTQTVSYGPQGPDIQIIIININTGERSCKRQNGDPCFGFNPSSAPAGIYPSSVPAGVYPPPPPYGVPSGMVPSGMTPSRTTSPCLSTGALTSFSTKYNTVTATSGFGASNSTTMGAAASSDAILYPVPWRRARSPVWRM